MLIQDLVPCLLVTFEKEQIVVWRGKDYKPQEDGYLNTDKQLFNYENSIAADDKGDQ